MLIKNRKTQVNYRLAEGRILNKEDALKSKSTGSFLLLEDEAGNEAFCIVGYNLDGVLVSSGDYDITQPETTLICKKVYKVEGLNEDFERKVEQARVVAENSTVEIGVDSTEIDLTSEFKLQGESNESTRES